jgi:GGDEF domain-containing protein
VVDADGRCAGQVCIGDVIQGMARLTIEQGAALHPLTQLPGSDLVAQLVDRKVAERDVFAVSWLDVDDLGAVNDRSGFAAGDDLIRELGRVLAQAEQAFPSATVAHIGADDFVVITDPDDIMPLGSGVLDEPWEVDGCEVTLSLASLICSPGTVAGHRDISRMLARLHRHAKSMRATSWVAGRTSSDRVEVVRGDERVAPVA